MIGANKPNIQRVVTCFILSSQSSSNPKIAIFHRCATMPTFPDHWAAISGTIEPNETPYQAAQRELNEETNLIDKNCVIVDDNGGLLIDVPYRSPRTNQERIIRVYPFVAYCHNNKDNDETTTTTTTTIMDMLEVKGTEHDDYKFVTIEELEAMEESNQLVPDLVRTFHHATFGRYQKTIPDTVRQWASDQENGASIMTANALQLVHESEDPITTARQISMLRPSMVPIVNVMNQIIQQNDKNTVSLQSFQKELQRCVDLGIDTVQQFITESSARKSLTIATFSRSGTLAKILQSIQKHNNNNNNNDNDNNTSDSDIRITIICAQSTPGNEGELMAKDLNCDWISDKEMKRRLQEESSSFQKIDLLLIGSDCILSSSSMVNKVGTKELCTIAKRSNVPVYCCADRWKLWEDIFAPPLEKELFERVPLDLVTKLIVPEKQNSIE